MPKTLTMIDPRPNGSGGQYERGQTYTLADDLADYFLSIGVARYPTLQQTQVLADRDPATGEVSTIGTGRDPLGAPVVAVTSPGGGNRLSAGGVTLSAPNTYLATRDTVNDRSVIGVIGRELVSVDASGVLFRSIDGGAWSVIGPAPADAPRNTSAIFALDDGEVLLKLYRTLWRSSGWLSGSPTWTKTLETENYGAAVPWFQPGWSINVGRQYVMASEYGSPKPNAYRAYLSTDYGATFTPVFDLRTQFVVDGASNCHLHGSAVDVWHGEIPRLWQITADVGFKGLWYSDNLGASWSRIPDAAYDDYVNTPALAEANNYTTITPTPLGLVLGADGMPDGVAYIPRDERYATSPRVRTALTFEDRSTVMSYVVRDARAYDDEWVLTLHDVPDSRVGAVGARIAVTSLRTGLGYVVHDFPIALGNGFQSIAVHDHTVWVRYFAGGQARMYRLPMFTSASVMQAGGAGATGHFRAGRAVADRAQNIAIHKLAEARVDRSIAIGPFARTNTIGQVVIGGRIDPTGENTVVIAACEASEGQTVATGNRITAIGYRPKVSTANSTAVGDRVTVGATNSTLLGSQITAASGANVVGLGTLSTLNNTETVLVGSYSECTADRAVVIGARAKATHAMSVAVGGYSETARANSVACGNRDVELQGNGRGLITRSPNGTLYKISVADGGTLIVAPV